VPVVETDGRTSSAARPCRARAARCGASATPPYKVQTLLHPLERELYYTNEAIEIAG